MIKNLDKRMFATWKLVSSNKYKFHENGIQLCYLADIIGGNSWEAFQISGLIPGKYYSPNNVNNRFISKNCLYHHDKNQNNDRLTLAQLRKAYLYLVYFALKRNYLSQRGYLNILQHFNLNDYTFRTKIASTL